MGLLFLAVLLEISTKNVTCFLKAKGPCVRNHNIVEGRFASSKSCQPNFHNHCVVQRSLKYFGCFFLGFVHFRNKSKYGPCALTLFNGQPGASHCLPSDLGVTSDTDRELERLTYLVHLALFHCSWFPGLFPNILWNSELRTSWIVS